MRGVPDTNFNFGDNMRCSLKTIRPHAFDLPHAITVMLIALWIPVSCHAADLVLTGGRIVTVNPDFDVVEAMAVEDGRVKAVGSIDDIQQFVDPDTVVVELNGGMVLPGLIDSHVHPTGASRFESDHEIPTMESISDVLDYVRQRAKVVPKGEWITLSQVFITRLREQRFPSRQELDGAAPEHPVLFRTGPDGSVNSLALKENGIDAAFAAKNPENIMVDAKTGEPNGIIRRQSKFIRTRTPPGRKSLNDDEKDERLLDLLRDYARTGITSVIDRNCNDSARAQYARLLQSGDLPIRVRMSRSLSAGADPAAVAERLDSIAADSFFQMPDPRLAVIGVKVFEDGGMLTGSAYFREPWGISTIYGITDPRYRGMQYIDRQRLELLIRLCAERNLAFTAHCQGDAAVEALLESFEAVNEQVAIAPTRSSVTHSSFMSKHAIELAAKLGVGVDLQPAWLFLDARTLVSHFGSDRLKYFIPLKSLLEAGVRAGGGSDHMQKIGSLRSVNPYNPFLGMWVAATRSARWHAEPVHPEQALSREEMIRFYTINNAWLMRYDSEVGSLEPGKRADFIVVDRDLLVCPVEDIRETQVLSTWLDGRKVSLDGQQE